MPFRVPGFSTPKRTERRPPSNRPSSPSPSTESSSSIVYISREGGNISITLLSSSNLFFYCSIPVHGPSLARRVQCPRRRPTRQTRIRYSQPGLWTEAGHLHPAMSNPSGQGPVGQPGPGGSYGGHPPSSGGTSAAPVGGAPAPSAPSAQNLNQIVSSSCLLYRLLCSLFPSPSPVLLVSEAPDLHVSLTICPCVCMHNVCGGLSLKTSPSQFPSVALLPRDSQAPLRLCLLLEATPRNICICWSAQIFLQFYQWPGNLLCPGHQMESAVFEPRF